MDKKGDSHLKLEILAEKCEKLKKEFSEQKELYFFDVLIDCGSIILPAHRFVLRSRSDVLAQQLSPDVNELNWTDYGADFGIACLRWIYTNKIDFDNVTLPGLHSASHQFQSTVLFGACELLSSINVRTDEEIIKYQNIGKIVGSAKLVANSLELQPNGFSNSVVKSPQVEVDHQANTNSHGCDTQMEVDTEIEQRVNDLAEEVKKFEKISIGCREFRTLSDLNIRCSGSDWPAHEYFISNRNTKVYAEISGASNVIFYCTPVIMRWLYTDVLELGSVDIAMEMLSRSSYYMLPTVFERCEEALLKIVDITSYVRFLKIATYKGATKILKRCQELINYYGKVLQSEGSLKMDVDFDFSGENSICEEETCELPMEGVGGLLNLNDDCLLHLFRYLPLVDLGSIKDTCKRLSQLADQSFKLRKDKSITIRRHTMVADVWNLTHFGKLLNSLTVYDIYEKFASYNEIFQIIAKYSNEHLKAFTAPLRCTIVESLTGFEKVLKNVEKLELRSVDNSGHIDLLLGYCENLRDVYIQSYIPLQLEIKPLWWSKNVNITCLALNYLEDDEILVEICEKLPHLECFELGSSKFSSKNISCLSQLGHLSRLKIDFHGIENSIENVFQKFAEENHLEYLCLSNMTICESLAHSLGQFQNLKELVFCQVTNAKSISSKLANVEKLAFVHCYYTNFGDVTQIVENLLKLKELSFTGGSGGHNPIFIDRNNYLRLTKNRNRNLEIFLWDNLHPTTSYKKSIECIANDLRKYVRVTARTDYFFDALCDPKVMN